MQPQLPPPISVEVGITELSALDLEEIGSDELMVIYFATTPRDTGSNDNTLVERRVKHLQGVREGFTYPAEFFAPLRFTLHPDSQLVFKTVIFEVDNYESTVATVNEINRYARIPLGILSQSCNAPTWGCVAIKGASWFLTIMKLSTEALHAFDKNDFLGEHVIQLHYNDFARYLQAENGQALEWRGVIQGPGRLNPFEYRLRVQSVFWKQLR